MPNAYVLVGLPGVGKSTWVSGRAPIASSDKFVELMAKALGMTYNEAFPKAIKAAEANFWDSLDGWDRDIYIDRTNLTVKSRARLFKALPNHTFTAIVFPTTSDWKERLAGRPGKQIPEHVLRSMDQGYQPPTLDEGFHQIIVDPCGPQ